MWIIYVFSLLKPLVFKSPLVYSETTVFPSEFLLSCLHLVVLFHYREVSFLLSLKFFFPCFVPTVHILDSAYVSKHFSICPSNSYFSVLVEIWKFSLALNNSLPISSSSSLCSAGQLLCKVVFSFSTIIFSVSYALIIYFGQQPNVDSRGHGFILRLLTSPYAILLIFRVFW
jgi:hypothetical protein